MPISQKQDAAQQQSEFKFYLAVEKLHQKVFSVSSLPPFKIERIGSNKSQLLGEVRRSLIKCFANWKPRTWAMPIPGSNPSFEPPAALTLRVDLKLTELGSSNTVPLDIGFVRWQVDEKHHAYHAPSLDRTWIGRASYWENGPLVSECLSEIEFRRKKRDLSFLQDWLFNRTIEVRVLRFPALLLSQPKADKDKTCTPVLNKTSNRISSWIRGNIYERDGLVDQVAEILFSKVAQSVLLVGEPGVGKTSIVQHLPKRHAALENLWSTSGSRLVSGQCGWGMWQRQFEALLKELRNTRGYLHVGSLVELVESGKLEDAPGVASRMKPELQRGNIRVIAECTPAQYQRLERNDPALLRCFLRVDVEELAPEKNLRLLERVAWDWLSERQAELEEIGYRQPIYMEPNTIQTIEALCRRFCRYSVMPSVPLRLIQSAISILESGSALSPSSMMQAFTAQTGMPRFLIDDQVPLEYEELRGKLANRLISGMRYLGQWQERVETAVQVLNDVQGFLILENLRDMVRLGDSSPRDSMAAFLVPFIRTGQVRMIVESTPSELDAIQQLVPGIVEALPIFKVQPWTPSSEELLLHRLLDHRLSDRKIYVEPEIPRTIQRLCSQFQSASAPPSATVRFAEKMVDRLIKRGKKDALCVNEVVTQFSELYGVPEVLLRDELPLDKSSIVESLKSEVIGQQRPCEVAANVFSRIKSNLNDPGRPFANLFFCGPTGVGKTQLAKAIAKALFGYQKHKTPLVRVDMSEYSSPGSSALFLQDNTGNPATWLLNIRNRPLSVLLLDEVEKASPDVFDVLLSLLDEGRLTDRYGQTTSFRSCVIIMTSNIGVRRGGSLGFNEESNVDFRAEIRRAFRPEFFNRLDEIVAFNPLGFDAIAAIAAKELRDLSDREGIHQRNIQLEWTQQVLERLARVGFHPELGARPLQKAVESNIVGPLSRWLVKHKAVSNCRLLLDFDGDSLIIQQPS